MKNIYFAIVFLLLPLSIKAQILKGDMDDDGTVSIKDITELVNTVLGKKEIQTITINDMIDNSIVAGLWYKNREETVSFIADGTTNYPGADKFKFIPVLNYLVLCNQEDEAIGILNVTSVDNETLCINNKYTYTKYVPKIYVSNIKLNANTVQLYQNASIQISSTISPSDADNKSLIWTSSDTSVATVKDGMIKAVSLGTATITCTAADGSGVKAVCTLTVSPEGNPGDQVSDGSGA